MPLLTSNLLRTYALAIGDVLMELTNELLDRSEEVSPLTMTVRKCLEYILVARWIKI